MQKCIKKREKPKQKNKKSITCFNNDYSHKISIETELIINCKMEINALQNQIAMSHDKRSYGK